jgi:hypothetical protein
VCREDQALIGSFLGFLGFPWFYPSNCLFIVIFHLITFGKIMQEKNAPNKIKKLRGAL